MPYAVALCLDHDAETAVRGMWRALDDVGIPSLASVAGARYRPHVSLAVFDEGDLGAAKDAVASAAGAALGLPLQLSALGFFLTEEAAAFLAVTPSDRLLRVHARVVAALRPHVSGFWPHYEPDVLLPHCTLAMGITDQRQVHETAARFQLPVRATVAEVHLVEILTGSSVTCLASE